MPLLSDTNLDPPCPETILVENPLSSWLDDTPATTMITVTKTRYVPVNTSTPAPTTPTPATPATLTTAQHASTSETQHVSATTTMAKSFVWPRPPWSIIGAGRVGTVIDGRAAAETAVADTVISTEVAMRKVDATQEEQDEFAAGHVVEILRRLASAQSESYSHELSPPQEFTPRRLYQTNSSAPSMPSTFFTTTTTPTTSESHTSTQETYATHHNYHAIQSLNAAQLRYNHPPLIGRSLATNMGDFELPPLPAVLQLALYICLALGSIWVVTVWLVSFPPGTWSSTATENTATESATNKKSDTKKEQRTQKSNEAKTPWFRRFLPPSPSNMSKRKPLDKPRKYIAIPSTSSTSPADSSTAATSETPTSTLLRKRTAASPPGKQQHQDQELELEDLHPASIPHSPNLPPWQRAIPPPHQRNSPSTAPPSPGIHINRAPSRSPSPSSPQNPFIPTAPAPPRTSTDYLTAHTAFFKSTPSPPSSRAHSPSTTSTLTSNPTFRYEDINALEAQTELPSHRRSKSEVHLSPIRTSCGSHAGGCTMKKRWSGVNVLEAVDGAVSWGVERMVRWTEDGGEEGVVLPVVGGRAARVE